MSTAKRSLRAGSTLALLLVAFLFTCRASYAAVCAVCGNVLYGPCYLREDKVTHTKVMICSNCIRLPDVCYICGLPVLHDFTTLTDGRVICQRDTQSVVLDDREAVRICDGVKADLDRQFIRFINIPSTSVTVQMADRMSLQAQFRMIGNDYTCPNTLGCCAVKKGDHGRASFDISILSGQRKEDLMTTCVHEYGHTWLFENLPPQRVRRIRGDAVEGFCELLAYLYAEENGLTAGMSNILANRYTRGQVQLFIEAYRQYGFGDIVDWMKNGEDPLLIASDLGRIHRLMPMTKALAPAAPAGTETIAVGTNATTAPAPVPVAPVTPPPPQFPEKLMLQGIVWSARPVAVINNQNFFTGDVGTVRLRDGPVSIRCLKIQSDLVVLQTNDVGGQVTLRMR